MSNPNKGAVRAEQGAGSAGAPNSDPDANAAAEAKAKADAEAEAKDKAKALAEAEAAEKAKAKADAPPLPEYVVAPGKSITSLRGILDEGAEVRVVDFYASGSGDAQRAEQQAALDHLVKAGVVIHNQKAAQK